MAVYLRASGTSCSTLTVLLLLVIWDDSHAVVNHDVQGSYLVLSLHMLVKHGIVFQLVVGGKNVYPAFIVHRPCLTRVAYVYDCKAHDC